MKNIFRSVTTLLLAVLFLSVVSSAQAVYFGSGNNFSLPKDKKMDETVFVAGSDLVVDSNITGDLFCAGQNITINGNIKGDVICAGQIIKINGAVDGDVRVAGQTIEINGSVSRNVTSLSQNLTLAKSSSVKGDILFGVQNVDLRGSLGRDMAGGAEQITITGSLLRHALITASRVSVVEPAKIGGNFEYYLEKTGTVSVEPKMVKGEIIKHEIVRKEVSKQDIEKVSTAARGFGKIYWIISTLLLGGILIYFLKERVVDRISLITEKPVITGLIGLGVLILTPLITIILLASVIGIPVAFILVLEYIISLVLAHIYPIIMVGEWLFKKTSQKSISLGWSLVAGCVVTGLLLLVPVLGSLLGFVFLCLGLGATFLSFLPKK